MNKNEVNELYKALEQFDFEGLLNKKIPIDDDWVELAFCCGCNGHPRYGTKWLVGLDSFYSVEIRFWTTDDEHYYITISAQLYEVTRIDFITLCKADVDEIGQIVTDYLLVCYNMPDYIEMMRKKFRSLVKTLRIKNI